MAVDIQIQVKGNELKAVLQRLQKAAQDQTPAMAAIAEELRTQTEENFAQQGRPKWPVLKSPGERRQGGMVLQDSGQLAASITTEHSRQHAMIGTNKVYAAIHQFGGKTKAHEIKAKNKKALAFGGKIVRSVQHPGSVIPARPFLPIDADGNLQSEAAEAVLEIITEHLARAAQKV